jgi:hypothetical protein
MFIIPHLGSGGAAQAIAILCKCLMNLDKV